MPASRLLRKNIDGRQLINEAANKAGDLRQLAQAIGYGYESLLAIRNNGMVSRKLEKRLQEYLFEREAA